MQFRIEQCEKSRERTKAELAESRRANAHLREAIIEMRDEFCVFISYGSMDRISAALSATATDYKTWEDALFGEPVAMLFPSDDKDCFPVGYGILVKDTHPAIAELTQAFHVFAKPKGLK